MARKVTSIKVDDVLWRDFKIKCISENKDLSERIEELLKKELKK